MSGDDSSLDDHSNLSRELLNDVENFVKEIGTRSCTTHLKNVTDDGHYLKGRKLGQEPERFIEDNLIFPVLQTLGHSVIFRPVQYAPKWAHGRGIPDFCLTTVSVQEAKQNNLRLFGEVKTPNKLQYARDDVREYLQKDLDFHAAVILTDGIEWELWLRPRHEPLAEEYDPHETTSLQNAFGYAKAQNLQEHSYSKHEARQSINQKKFHSFTASALFETIESEFDITISH